MFHLPAGPWPSTADQLRQQLSDGLRPLLDGVAPLTLSGQWPVLDMLSLDLSGLEIDPSRRLIMPKPAAERRNGPGCRELRIWAAPLRIGAVAKPHFDLRVSDLQFEFSRDEAGRQWLKPIKAGNGSAKIRMTKAELNALFLEAARELARSQGISVDDATVRLEPAGRGTIKFNADVNARKVFLKGRLCFEGTVEIDQAFDLRLHGLKCEGAGPIGGIAARTVRPYLARLDRVVSLPQFAPLLTGLTLQRLTLRSDDDSLEFDLAAGFQSLGRVSE